MNVVEGYKTYKEEKKHEQEKWTISVRDGLQRLPFIAGKAKHHKQKHHWNKTERLNHSFRKSSEINVAY